MMCEGDRCRIVSPGHVVNVGPNGRWGEVVRAEDGKLEYRTWRDRGRHFHRNLQAWAISLDVLDTLHRLKVERIALAVKGEGRFVTTMARFDRDSTVHDFGHGEQAFLHESAWNQTS